MTILVCGLGPLAIHAALGLSKPETGPGGLQKNKNLSKLAPPLFFAFGLQNGSGEGATGPPPIFFAQKQQTQWGESLETFAPPLFS